MSIPLKRRKISNDPFDMNAVNDSLSESIIEKKYNKLEKKINDLEITLKKNNDTIENLTKEIQKLSEVLSFFLEKKEEKEEYKHIYIPDNKPDYIS